MKVILIMTLGILIILILAVLFATFRLYNTKINLNPVDEIIPQAQAFIPPLILCDDGKCA